MSAITFSAVYLPLLLSTLTLLICIISVIFLRAYVKRRTSKEWIMQKGIMAEIRDEIKSLVKSIDETADRDISLITEKEKNIRSLIDELDKRFKVYIREMDKWPVYSALSTESAGQAMAGVPDVVQSGQNPMDAYLDLGKLRYRVKNQERNLLSLRSGIPSDGLPSAAGSDAALLAESNVESSQSVSEQIYSMLKAGFSEALIASRLGLSIAEVEFTAALLERREYQRV